MDPQPSAPDQPSSPAAGPDPSPRAAPPPPATTAAASGETGTLLPILIVLALALGLTTSWAVHEQRARSRELSRLHSVVKNAALLQARSSELAQFLLLPDTQVIHLRGTGAASGQAAAIAWNPRRGQGYVLVDSDAVSPLRLMADPPDGPPVQLLQFHPTPPGGHAFSLPVPLPEQSIRFSLVSVPADPADDPVRYEPI